MAKNRALPTRKTGLSIDMELAYKGDLDCGQATRPRPVRRTTGTLQPPDGPAAVQEHQRETPGFTTEKLGVTIETPGLTI